MCEAIQTLVRRAAREAEAAARVETFITTCKELGVSLADTTARFADKFSVPLDNAATIVKKHW